MDKNTLKALRGSIRKWEEIVAGTGVDLGTSNCPLCRLFYTPSDCVGCPVQNTSGQFGCVGTPYINWSYYVLVKHGRNNVFDNMSLHYAQAELDFLKSLLPKKCTRTRKGEE